MPVSVKQARLRQSWASSRSPWSTLISTLTWPSTKVVKTSVARVGIVVFRGMSVLTTPPMVSMPSDRGVMSSRSSSWLFPARMSA